MRAGLAAASKSSAVAASRDDGDRRVAGALQARQRHHRQERSNVQARRGRIETDVARHRASPERIADPFGPVVQHLAPLEFAVEILGWVRHDSARYYTVSGGVSEAADRQERERGRAFPAPAR